MALTTTAKVKDYLGITVSTYDALIATLILAAQAKVERFCNRKFDAASFTEYHDGNCKRSIVLRNTPVNTVTSVSYRKDNDEWTAYDTTLYDFDADSGILEMVGTSSAWFEAGYDHIPTGFPKGNKAVVVVYNGGYSSIPADLEHATNELVGLMYGGSAALRQARLTGLQSESLGYESRTWNNAAEGFHFMAERFGDYRRHAI